MKDEKLVRIKELGDSLLDDTDKVFFRYIDKFKKEKLGSKAYNAVALSVIQIFMISISSKLCEHHFVACIEEIMKQSSEKNGW